MKRVLMMLILACLAWTPTIRCRHLDWGNQSGKVYNGYWKTDVENKKLKTKQEEALDRIKKLEESLRKEGDCAST